MNDLQLNMVTVSGSLPSFDMAMTSTDLTTENSLYTAVVMSLFTDRLANTDDVIPDATNDRRGWWADAIADVAHDKVGSRLWLLDREKQTVSVLRRAEEYAYEALTWLLDDGIAKQVRVVATNPKTGWLRLDIEIDRPDLPTARFDYLWEALSSGI